MAENDLLVTISGPALSLLFYENACSEGDQIGFLLGDVELFVTKSVTDSERTIETTRRHIEITGILAMPVTVLVHDNAGKLNKETMRKFVKERGKEIVGWFRFRRNNPLVASFRDKILHKQLAEYFDEFNGNTPKQYFLACIVNAMTTEKRGTHKFKHVLLRYQGARYRPVQLRINNLGDGAAQQDGSDYKQRSKKINSDEPDVFSKFIRSLQLNRDHITGSELVMTIQKSADRHLESLIPRLCESDHEVAQLECQIRELNKRIRTTMSANVPIEFNRRAQEMEIEGEQNTTISMKKYSPNSPMAYGEEVLVTPKSECPSSKIKKTPGKQYSSSKGNVNRSQSGTVQKDPSSTGSYSKITRNKSSDNEELFSAPGRHEYR